VERAHLTRRRGPVLGKTRRERTYKGLKWSQGNRWYFWHAGDDFGYNNDFVAQHSSNNHLIPATPKPGEGGEEPEGGRHRRNDGQLVDVAATKKSQNYRWNSSISTTDRGDGSCEIIYLTHLKVHGKIYQ